MQAFSFTNPVRAALQIWTAPLPQRRSPTAHTALGTQVPAEQVPALPPVLQALPFGALP